MREAGDRRIYRINYVNDTGDFEDGEFMEDELSDVHPRLRGDKE